KDVTKQMNSKKYKGQKTDLEEVIKTGYQYLSSLESLKEKDAKTKKLVENIIKKSKAVAAGL
ncbi:hypothetical protein JXB01_03315, partial [Candidatus Micrarchaeota archaeon]|nr:hypothetical protein [Candidatus Micrarchaeota archaeon]